MSLALIWYCIGVFILGVNIFTERADEATWTVAGLMCFILAELVEAKE